MDFSNANAEATSLFLDELINNFQIPIIQYLEQYIIL